MTTNKVCGKGKCKFTDEFCASGGCPYDTENVANNVVQRNSQDYVKKPHNAEENEQKTHKNLTEQWKKGELERGWYYVLLFSNEEYITFIDGNWVVDDRLIGADIKEVLAPIPSYKEYDVMKYRSSRFSVRHFEVENQRLKSYLRECREYIGNNFVSPQMRKTLTEIDEVLK